MTYNPAMMMIARKGSFERFIRDLSDDINSASFTLDVCTRKMLKDPSRQSISNHTNATEKLETITVSRDSIVHSCKQIEADFIEFFEKINVSIQEELKKAHEKIDETPTNETPSDDVIQCLMAANEKLDEFDLNRDMLFTKFWEIPTGEEKNVREESAQDK